MSLQERIAAHARKVEELKKRGRVLTVAEALRARRATTNREQKRN